MYCKVVFDVPLDRDFDYRVPPELENAAQPGVRITAPFGPMLTTGLITQIIPVCWTQSRFLAQIYSRWRNLSKKIGAGPLDKFSLPWYPRKPILNWPSLTPCPRCI